MIHAIDDRVGIDAFIYNIQQRLDLEFSNLDVYGRAELRPTREGDELPMAFLNGENKDLLYSEGDKCFFMVDGGYKFSGYRSYELDLFVYFCFDLKKSQLNETRLQNKCKEAIDSFMNTPDLDTNYKVVFDKFKKDGKDKLSYFPYHWFRFKSKINFKVEMT